MRRLLALAGFGPAPENVGRKNRTATFARFGVSLAAIGLLGAASAAPLKDFQSFGAPQTPTVRIHDEAAFARCHSRHVKPGMDAKSREILERGFIRAATPKRCRDLSEPDAPTPRECQQTCADASYLARRFGACSVDDTL